MRGKLWLKGGWDVWVKGGWGAVGGREVKRGCQRRVGGANWW